MQFFKDTFDRIIYKVHSVILYESGTGIDFVISGQIHNKPKAASYFQSIDDLYTAVLMELPNSKVPRWSSGA